MPAKLKVSDFVDAIGATRREIDTWLTRKNQINLRTPYEETVSGSARRFSYLNVLELALVVAFVRAGLPVSTAVAMVDPMLDAAGPERCEWAVLVAADATRWRMVSTNDLSAAFAGKESLTRPSGVPVFHVVGIGEIRRRVDALFAEE